MSATSARVLTVADLQAECTGTFLGLLHNCMKILGSQQVSFLASVGIDPSLLSKRMSSQPLVTLLQSNVGRSTPRLYTPVSSVLTLHLPACLQATLVVHLFFCFLLLDLQPVSKSPSASAPVEIHEILPQLLEVLASDQPVRLVKSGKLAGLFASAGGRNAHLIAACIDSSPALLERVGQAGAPDPKSQNVCLTTAGLEAIGAALPIADVERVAATAASRYRNAFRSACVKTTRGRLAQLVDKQRQLIAEGRQLLDNANQELLHQIDAINGERQHVEATGKKLDAAIATARPPRLEPADDREYDFLRNAADLLVYAWQDAVSSDVRMALEGVFVGLGIKPMYRTGTVLPFDGRHHETMDAVELGENVVVSQPGWALKTHRGTVMLTKSLVCRQPTLPNAAEPSGVEPK